MNTVPWDDRHGRGPNGPSVLLDCCALGNRSDRDLVAYGDLLACRNGISAGPPHQLALSHSFEDSHDVVSRINEEGIRLHGSPIERRWSAAGRFGFPNCMLIWISEHRSGCAIASHFVRRVRNGPAMPYQPINVPLNLIGRIHLEAFTNPVWRQMIARHAHRFLEAHLLVRGSAVIVMGNQRVDLPTGALVWIPPRTEHLTLEASPTLQRWCLCLRIGAVQRILPRDDAALLLSRRGGTRCVQLARVELQELARVLEDVAAQMGKSVSVTNAGLAYALTRAHLALCRSTPSDEPVTLHPAVTRALSLMQGDGLSLSRDELAARCRVAPTHLSRLFVQELGQSLRDVRSRKRLARCQELLASGQCDSLTEAALEGGFGSYSQFHRVFTRLTGRSPSGRTRSR